MKMCAKCGGSMKKGGATKSLPKAQDGKPVKSTKKEKKSDYSIQKGNWSFDKDGKIKTIKKMKAGGIAKDNAELKSIINRNGVPNSGTTGPISMKKGGATKSLPKAQDGGIKKYQEGGIKQGRNITEKAAKRKASKGKGMISYKFPSGPSNPPGSEGNKGQYTPFTRQGRIEAESINTLNKYLENDKTLNKKFKIPVTVSSENMKPRRKIMKSGGATSFGMLSVKAGIDKNPKPTAADRIAGAKMKKKMGGSTKKK